jgi:5-methylcytosine-specific restriction protein A
MPWLGSTRRTRLPKDWAWRRARVLERDGYRCTAIEHGHRCPYAATDVDHRTPGDDHRLANLQALCRWHHARKSSREGNDARRARSARRGIPKHPGLTA